MSFTLLPAVDVADGQAVRLVQGEAGTETGYGDPLRGGAGLAARRRRVDPSRRPRRRVRPRVQRRAARRGRRRSWTWPSSCPAASATTRRWSARWPPGAPGSTSAPPRWRTRDWCAQGDRRARRADRRRAGRRITDGAHRLAARGWTTDGGDLWETLERLDRDGCARYVVTDVSKDGTLRGPNVDLLRDVAAATTGAGDRLRRHRRGRPTWSRWPRRPHRGRTSRARSSARRCTPAGSRCPRRWPRCARWPRPGRPAELMAVAVRVIPCLDVDAGRVVKGVNFPTCATRATRSRWPASTTPRARTS